MLLMLRVGDGYSKGGMVEGWLWVLNHSSMIFVRRTRPLVSLINILGIRSD